MTKPNLLDKIRKKIGVPETPTKSPAEIISHKQAASTGEAKPPRPRKCCKSMKGEAHQSDCKTLSPPKPKAAKVFFHLPHGAVFHGEYDEQAGSWSVELRIGDYKDRVMNRGVHGALMMLGRRWIKSRST